MPALGGAIRQESVRNGLEALAAEGAPEIVLIHDAARPFADAALVARAVRGGRKPMAPPRPACRSPTR